MNKLISNTIFKSYLLVVTALLLTACGGGGGGEVAKTTTTSTTTTAGTGTVTFSGLGTSVIPISFIPTSSAVAFVVGNESALIWTNSSGSDSQIAADIANNGEATYIDVVILLTDNIVTEIAVSYSVITASSVTQYGWGIDDTMATINSTYDGTTVTFAGETLFEEFGAAGVLVINGSLGM